MLVDKITKRNELKVVSFRADKTIVDEFKELCKKYKVKQVSVFEKAMLKAIEEIKGLENAK